MKESLKQTQQQRLRQTLSPVQVQFVRTLEMTGPEIEEEVRRELDDNPALEAVADTDQHADDTALPATVDAEGEDFKESAEELQMADYASPDDIPYYRLEANNTSPDSPYFEPVTTGTGASLFDTLMTQVAQSDASERVKEIARFIAGNIDDNGYQTRTLAAVADDAAIHAGIDPTREEVLTAWRLIRSLDPAGVGATDLRDCLLLQLERRPDTQARRDADEMVRHYYDLFSHMRFNRIRSMTGITEQRMKDALALIRSLNPKPGSAIAASADDERVAHITPDFIVEADPEGRLTLIMPNRVPQLQVEQSFAAGADITPGPRTARHQEAEAFIRRKRDEAETFIKAVRMRRETLMRVMTAIMKLQREFFLTDDPLKLRPMVLRDVADATGYDISVVSRAAAGKYVATMQGVYPLKFFFNERPKDDSDTSSIVIRDALRRLVEGEDPSKPLSDDILAERLRAEGFDIARRTVAKYREKEGIPVARLRHKL